MNEIFNEIAKEIKDNKGKSRAIHIVLKDGTDNVILKINENGERRGEYAVYSVDNVGKFLKWRFINRENYVEKHITPLDSIVDVYINIMN